MIVTNIDDFEDNVRKHLNHAIKNQEYIFLNYKDTQFIILSDEMMDRVLYGAIDAGARRAKEKNDI